MSPSNPGRFTRHCVTGAEYESVDPSLTPEEGEKERLRRFARLVEKIKEEQRKRELQLEQSPEQQRSQ